MQDMDRDMEINETELLLRICKGDEAAFSHLFYMYSDRIFRFLFKITRSEVTSKDLLQDIFLKLWQNRASLPEINNLNAYLFRMAQNHAFNEIERFAKKTLSLSEHFDLEEDHSSPTPIEAMISKEIREKFAEAVNRLPPKQQQIFVLHKEQGNSYDEIARQLNLSVSTIHSHMHQALINLRRYLIHVYPDLFMIVMAAITVTSTFFLKK
jgi:RNA polymerase sigma-70 factor (family 1)